MRVDYKNELLTCLSTYQSDMVYWGVNLPKLPTGENEIDMEVDQKVSPDKQMSNFSDPVDNRMYKPSQGKDYEEYKVANDFESKAVIQPRQEPFRNSQSESHAVPPAKGDDFDRSTYSQAESLDKTTFKLNSDTPVGIDIDNFGSKPNSEDLQVIDNVLTKHFNFVDNLKQRNQKLRNILSLYSPYKSINMTLSALEQMNDQAVTNDV